jgi:hypothetical protein
MGDDRGDDLLEDDVRDGGRGCGVGDGQSKDAQGVDSRGLVDAVDVLSELANGLILLPQVPPLLHCFPHEARE